MAAEQRPTPPTSGEAARGLPTRAVDPDPYPAEAGAGTRIRLIARSRVTVNNARGRTSIVGRIPQDQLTVSVRPETFRERLTRLRTERGWTQHELAARSGVPRGTIAGSEAGTKTDVQAQTVALLASALGVTMQCLWLGEQAS